MLDPVFEDRSVVVYCGDARDIVPGLEARHGKVQHVFTDPPYSERTHRNARTTRGGAPGALVDFAAASFGMIREVLCGVGPGRWTVCFSDHVHAALLEVMPPDGMRHMRTGAWVKPNSAPQLTGDRPAQAHESITILHSMAPAQWNGGGKRGVWVCGTERDIPWHSTPKPIPLLRELLQDFSSPEELVVDPFAGSGSVGVACRWEGRRSVLIEKDPGIVAWMVQRLCEGRARPTLQMPAKLGDSDKQLTLFECLGMT